MLFQTFIEEFGKQTETNREFVRAIGFACKRGKVRPGCDSYAELAGSPDHGQYRAV